METHKTFYPIDFSVQAKTHRKIGIKPVLIQSNRNSHSAQSHSATSNYATYFQQIIYSLIGLLRSSGYSIPTVQDVSGYLEDAKKEWTKTTQADIELCNILNIDGLIVIDLKLPMPIEAGIKNRIYKYMQYLKGNFTFSLSIYLFDIKQDRVLWKRTIKDRLSLHHSLAFISKTLEQECKDLLSATYSKPQINGD